MSRQRGDWFNPAVDEGGSWELSFNVFTDEEVTVNVTMDHKITTYDHFSFYHIR